IPSSAGALSINGPHASITWSASFSGLAQLSVRGINACGTSSWSAPLEIEVVPALMAPAQPQGPVLFCTGGTTGSYSTELISNANSYHWVLNPANAGAITGSSNVAVIEWSAGFSGSATLKVAGQNACGSGPFSPVLEIFIANPIQASAGNDTTVNLGATVILKGSVDGSPQSLLYHWEPASLLVNADILQPVTLPLINATVFSLLITNTETGCTSGDDVLVVVEGASLSAQVTGSPLAICAGNTAQLSVQAYGGIVGNYQYSWSIAGEIFSNLQTIEVNPGNTTIYHVDVCDGNSTVSGSITVEVWPIPIADAGTDQSINNGAFTQLSGAASGGQEPFSYQWSPADSLLNPSQQSPLTKKLSTTTLFFLIVTDANGCTSMADQVVVNVNGGLLNINPVATDPVICFGETTQLFALASGGNNTYYYTWKVGNEVISTEENPLVAPLVTTTYSLQVYDTYNIATGTVTVQVDPLPGVNLIGPGVHYEGNTILACVFDTVSIVLNNPRASFLWSDGSTGNLMELSTSGFSFDLREIWVEVTDTLTGCRTRAEVNVSFTFVECSYGLDDFSKNDKLLLFPNPAGDKVIIRPVDVRNGDCLIQLFGITGNAISETSGHWSSEGIEINLENVAEGIYLLKVISDNETSLLKLVVSK
ncbi:MAG: T9SS type A sorting domain-containing protein, partial [Lentimicrobium sp.]|nr:T9SS type A sorting domain-containing protein [Lentimicrobium sp.]